MQIPIINYKTDFSRLIAEIAGTIDCGLEVYYNIQTFESHSIPVNEDYMCDFDNTFQEEVEAIEAQKEDLLHFEPLESHESFSMMESFAAQIKNDRYKRILVKALSQKSPFANFKYEIQDLGIQEQWYAFKKQYLEDHIKKAFELELEYMEDTGIE